MVEIQKKRIPWNLIKDKLFLSIILVLSFLILVPVIWILGYIFYEGFSYVNWSLLIGDERNGGILNAIVGSLIMVIVATLFAVPVGVLAGIFLSENKQSRFAEIIRVLVDVLQGVPSIVIGIIAYVWIVLPLKSFSAFSGALALSIIMLPVIIKNTEESLKLIPGLLKEAAYSIGAPYHKVIIDIVLPACLSGILTGILVAIARVFGETAPLLFTAFGNPDLQFSLFKPMEALPPLIYKYASSPDTDMIHKAWAASLILAVIVLILNISTRLVIKKLKR
ncbi:MAG: phosphate ABC transporter permease PstA [Spirochaetia bacterium]|nr:phosphate ABC transporter permease PstA [Spirochaetia bacterium]